MFKATRVLLITIFTLTSLAAFAGSQKIVSATNEEDNETMVLTLLTDSNSDITGLNMKTYSPSGRVIANKNFPYSGVFAGFTLMTKSNRKVVRLYSRNISQHNGGEVIVDYLYNGINNRRREMKFDLSRNGDVWELTKDSRKVKKLHFISNKRALIGTIGVKEVVIR